MQHIAYLLFVLLLIAVGAFIVATTGQLPERVASHFGAGNLANGWMTRSGYLVCMLVFALLLPVFVVGVVGWLPRRVPGAVNIPHRDQWMAPGRRATTLATLASHACWLGCLLAVFIAGIHFAVLEANAAVPPRLPADLFWTLLVGFLAAVALWIGALYLRYRNLS
jgi:uncharacterized membrane protein